MQTEIVVHTHSSGLTVLDVATSVKAESKDLVTAIYLDDPMHYELHDDHENLEVAAVMPRRDVTELVRRLQWVRSLRVGSKVTVRTVGGRPLHGTLVSSEEDHYPSFEPDFGPLFSSPTDSVMIRNDEGVLIETQLSELRPPDTEALSHPGKRIVVVNRTVTQQLTFTIDDSTSDEDAADQALDMAGNYDFNTAQKSDPDYTVESVRLA